jgi:hypothetical protein
MRKIQILNISFTSSIVVVIVGALFKIMHYPYSQPLLIIGLLSLLVFWYVSLSEIKSSTRITASEKFKNSIIECLNLIGINTRCYYRNNGYSINIVRYKDTYNFYNYLYNDSEMFLKRKKDKFILKELSQ